MSETFISATQLTEHMSFFQAVTKQSLEIMFNCVAEIQSDSSVTTSENYVTDFPFSIRIQFTGVSDAHLISGEYMIATDERVAGAACGVVDATASSAEVEAARKEISGGFSELLNTVVGEAVLALDNLGRLKFSTPRVCYGKMCYGGLEFRRVNLETSAGQIECHFYCDRVSLV